MLCGAHPDERYKLAGKSLVERSSRRLFDDDSQHGSIAFCLCNFYRRLPHRPSFSEGPPASKSRD